MKKSAEAAAAASGEVAVKKTDKKKVLKIILCVILALALIGIIYVAAVIITAPKIETDNIYSMLSQSSVLYDDEENIIDTAYGDQNRTIVEIDQIPEHVQNAFIALEDKTFRTHSGFNIIRIFGAIKDSIFGGGQIGGTSTITQQLARNLYLGDEMYERSINRKIKRSLLFCHPREQAEQRSDTGSLSQHHILWMRQRNPDCCPGLFFKKMWTS